MDTELVVFDMDGTLSNTAPGIIKSFLHVAHELGVPEPSREALYAVKGGSLIDDMAKLYGIGREEAIGAAELFKEFYGREGYLEAVLFPGMQETLDALRDMGIPMGVATMKPDEYAKQLASHWGLDGYFVDVCGADDLRLLSKSDLIDRCIYAAEAEPEKTLMVGDTPNDLRGARESGTRFVAVTFGYGFTPDICRQNGIPFTEDAGGVLDFI